MTKVKTEKVNAKACVFSVKGDNPFAFAKPAEGSDSKELKLSIVGYSGGVIENHWWWGNLVMDTSGVEFRKDKYPILFDHDTDQRIGFSDTPEVINHAIVINSGTLLDNEHANKFRQDCEAGFPFEASIRVEPLEIQRLGENEVAEVNGFKFQGPGTIFRKFVYKEVSACSFGWDSNTSSTVGFSKEDEVSYTLTEKETNMDINKWKTEDPEGYAAFCNSLTEPLNQQISELQTALTNKETELNTATQFSNQLEERINKLEREAMLREEQANQAAFSAKVSACLEKSGLPARLHNKFSATIKREGFVGEDGKFDDAKFNSFMESELKEWNEAIQPAVLGGGAGEFSKDEQKKDENDPASVFGSVDEYNAFRKRMGL